MSNFNMHSIKRAAHKEAWYGDSYNPFRKVRSGTMTSRDEEQGHPPLTTVQTEPMPESPLQEFEQGGRRHTTPPEKGAVTELSATKPERPSEQHSGTTVAEGQSIPAADETAQPRRRFVPGFLHRENKEARVEDADDEKPKQRPWYKGKKLHHSEPFTLGNQLRRTILNSWINLLLLAAPVGIALHYVGIDGTVVFVVNFIAIIPLAAMLSFATEEIALHVGESLGGLLNATFGNAVEMIIAIIALTKGEVVVVQASLIGSILSNLLLVLGMCFFFGGMRRKEQHFNQTVAQTAASLLALAVGSVIIPTCFDQFSSTPVQPIAALSRGTAIILLVVYAGYLFFQLKTHSDVFMEESKKVAIKPRKGAVEGGAVLKSLARAGGMSAGVGRAQLDDRPPQDELIEPLALELLDADPEEPQLHIAVAYATLAISTAIIGLCSEFMVDGISSITDRGVSVEFVSLILLPIVGNSAEHLTAISVAVKDKMDLAIGVAIGSSMQVALLLIPLLVIIGWGLGNDCMNLDFDGFQVAVMFVAVLLVNYLTQDGRSNWIEGMILICLYFIIAVCAFYYPETVNPKCPAISS